MEIPSLHHSFTVAARTEKVRGHSGLDPLNVPPGTEAGVSPGFSPGIAGHEEPAKVREAAAQFEALLLAQMLKSVREAASEGWMGAGGDEAGGMMLDVAQEHLAQVLAAQGGLGLADLVTQGLARVADNKTT